MFRVKQIYYDIEENLFFAIATSGYTNEHGCKYNKQKNWYIIYKIVYLLRNLPLD